MSTTTLSFPYEEDFWDIVEEWAYKNGFSLKKATPRADMRFYTGRVMTGKARMDISYKEGIVNIETWWSDRLFNYRLDKLGLGGSLPRSKSRAIINELLGELGQPQI